MILGAGPLRDLRRCESASQKDDRDREGYETYEFGDRFASAVPFETAPSLVPLDAADDVFNVAEAGGRSAGAEGADGASVGYGLGLASRSTEDGTSGAAGADATAVVMMVEGVQAKRWIRSESQRGSADRVSSGGVVGLCRTRLSVRKRGETVGRKRPNECRRCPP